MEGHPNLEVEVILLTPVAEVCLLMLAAFVLQSRLVVEKVEYSSSSPCQTLFFPSVLYPSSSLLSSGAADFRSLREPSLQEHHQEIAPPEGSDPSSFLDILISFLPGDDTNQLVIFSAIIGGMTLFLVAVGFALTRAKRKVEDESIKVFVGEEVEMMIDVIDEDAEMAVNLEEEIEIRLDTGSVVLEDAGSVCSAVKTCG